MADDGDNLRDYWHPVALSADIGDKLFAATLLNEQIVIWRSPEGIVAFQDLCIHRGTKLSLGWTEKSALVCPYHGWRYDAGGTCVHIPSLAPGQPIPSKAKIKKYLCTEKYGLVFVCLGEPKKPIIDFPDFGKDGFVTHYVGPVYFDSSAARSFENYIDDTHLAFVHPHILGDPNDVHPIPAHRGIEEKNGEFTFETETEVANRLDHADKGKTYNRIRYHVTTPFSLHTINFFADDRRYSKVFFTAPVTEKRTVRFTVVARNYDLDLPSEKMVELSLKVWEQDRPVVESQRPEQVPLDFRRELHLRDPDGPSVVYRRMLKELGVGELT